jgi:hypothetical protein
VTMHTASASAAAAATDSGFKGRRQAPSSEPVVRLRAEPALRNNPIFGRRRPAKTPNYQTNPFSSTPSLQHRHSETNLCSGAAVAPRPPITKQTHFQAPPSRQGPARPTRQEPAQLSRQGPALLPGDGAAEPEDASAPKTKCTPLALLLLDNIALCNYNVVTIDDHCVKEGLR